MGHIIIGDGIAVDPKKIQAIMDWTIPANISKVHSFMGFASYYHHFVKHFLCVSHPITSLQWKGMNYVWSNQCEVAFNALKESLTSAPVLAVPNPIGDFMVCMDDLL